VAYPGADEDLVSWAVQERRVDVKLLQIRPARCSGEQSVQEFDDRGVAVADVLRMRLKPQLPAVL
jgi:hypothetical protein